MAAADPTELPPPHHQSRTAREPASTAPRSSPGPLPKTCPPPLDSGEHAPAAAQVQPAEPDRPTEPVDHEPKKPAEPDSDSEPYVRPHAPHYQARTRAHPHSPAERPKKHQPQAPPPVPQSKHAPQRPHAVTYANDASTGERRRGLETQTRAAASKPLLSEKRNGRSPRPNTSGEGPGISRATDATLSPAGASIPETSERSQHALAPTSFWMKVWRELKQPGSTGQASGPRRKFRTRRSGAPMPSEALFGRGATGPCR
jgi:hypothetical protein